MTKLVYNKEKLINVIKPNLQNAISDIQKALDASHFSIPSDFAQYNYLANLNSNISINKTKLNNCERWLSQAISEVDRTLEEIENSAKVLEEPKIVAKENSVIIP